jgi:uncharacterized protein YebE (UPF0316 family)
MHPPSFDPVIWKWLILPALIFLARICDVSLGTVRIIFVTRGMRYLAPVVGFFEVLIWLLAISQIMRNLSDAYCYLAYASGFAAGTFIGISIENRLAMGVALIRVITQNHAAELVGHLQATGCGVTVIDAQGLYQPVKVIFTIVKRKHIRKIIEIIKRSQPAAIYTIEDVRTVSPRVFKNMQPECSPAAPSSPPAV